MAETRMVDGIELGPNSPQVGEDGTVTAPVEQKPAGDRPAWLPQNFDKPEAMVESYKSLQAELTKLKQGTNTEADPAETPEAKAAREAEEAAKAAAEGEKPATENMPEGDPFTVAQEVVKKAGLDWAAMEKTYAETKKFSEADYEAIEKVYPGVSRSMVDAFVAGQIQLAQVTKADAETFTAGLVASIGGEAQFDVMAKWAVTNWTDAQKTLYAEDIGSSDKAKMTRAVNTLKADYTKATGSAAQLLKGSPLPASDGTIYRDWSEVQKDMGSDQYKTSEAFRQDVQNKLARSKDL